jgi:membrane-associated phospholipid phosphatase
MRVLIALLVLVTASSARAESWYRGKYGKNRVLHLSIGVGGLAIHAATSRYEEDWMADSCRWCHPTAVDVAVRDALRWDNTPPANTLSNVAAYGVVPAVSVGLVLAGTLEEPSVAAVIDDVAPILEAVTITQWVTSAIKIGVGRERPDAHFDTPSSEQNLSFPSGHTSSAVSIAVSAAVVARMRHYRSETGLWIGGALLAASVGYLRIAADRHYATDVLTGAAIGASVGLTVPYLMRRDVTVMPTHDGIAVVGAW